MSAVAVPLPVARRLAPARLTRPAAFGALALWGALRWARLVAPGAALVLIVLLLLAAAFGLALARSLRAARPRAPLAATGGLGGVVAFAGILLLVGVPSALVLDPRNWGALATGISEGLQGLPNAPSPYDGADTWVRSVTLLGGGLLLAGGASALAGLPARARLGARAAALAPLVLLAAVPAVVLPDREGVLQGVPLFLLLGAALWAEEVELRAARGALVLALAAAAVGLAAGSAIDAGHPWLHYDRLVLSLAPSHAETFDWNHRYGPLDWTRTGREVLRVRMRRRVYLKAQNLDSFDGTAWQAGSVHPGLGERTELPAHPDPRWRETLFVSLRSLASGLVVGAGTSLAVTGAPVRVVGTGSPGTFDAVGELRPGSSYEVSVYAPTPSARALGVEPADYPGWTGAYRELVLPGRDGRPLTAQFAPYGSGLAPRELAPSGYPVRSVRAIERSGYGRAYALARRLASGAATPYAFAARVRGFLRGPSFRYSERAPRVARPLETFLFRDRRGYCQQFSGAMALLLRMGGVPARVAAGFTPGEHDAPRDDWVVRDYDAHSWVEVWFPREGWVTFDPTPPAAPALSFTLPRLRPGDAPQFSRRGRPSRAGALVPHSSGGPGAAGLGLLALAGVVLLGGAAAVARRLTRARRADGVAELADALRRCGRAPAPTVTLRELERRLRGTEAAGAYVRALREARYGWPPEASGAGGRRALRRELARGLGPSGRLRALWALPPRRARSLG